MIVTACDKNYLPYAQIWLRSVLRRGQIAPTQVSIMAIGNRNEVLEIEENLGKIAPKIHFIPVNPENKDFNFLAAQTPPGRIVVFSDYLRAWVARKVGRYIWLDCDTIVRGSLQPMIRMMRQSTGLILGPDVPNLGSIPEAVQMNIAGFQKCFGKSPPVERDADELPITFNSGVIVADRDYSREWKSLYRKLTAHSPNGKPDKKALQKSPFTGQTVWNILYWSQAQPQKLESRFHFFAEPRRKIPTQAVVVHYPGARKDLFRKHARRLGLTADQ